MYAADSLVESIFQPVGIARKKDGIQFLAAVLDARASYLELLTYLNKATPLIVGNQISTVL